MRAQEPATAGAFKLSSLSFSVYLPAILFSLGEGAVLPIVPLFARELGASVATASLVVGMRGIGTMIFDLPVGVIVGRFGDKTGMVCGTAILAVVAIMASFSPSPAVLGIASFLMGVSWAFYSLARLAYVSEITPSAYRGRAMSMLGGMNRIGTFGGPALGGFLGQHLGLESVFYFQALVGGLAAVMMFIVVPVTEGAENIDSRRLVERLTAAAVHNRSALARVGVPIMILQGLRQVRAVLLALWGDSIGLSVSSIGAAFSISYFIETGLFYPAGIIMDSWGRKWVAVPCLLIIAIGLLLLPLSQNFAVFLAVATVTALGNGLGSGIFMTLGADFAPQVGRGEFLGIWRLLADMGGAGGPLAVGAISAAAGLAAASLFCAGLGVLGGLMMLLLVKEPLHRPPKVPT
jgi:MFS family permease